MRGLVTVLLAVITGMFCSFVTYLPFIGDVNSAPNQHVTPVYIERSVQDTGSPNIVTGLLADYRGFDTMWETTVMFLAGLTVVMLLIELIRRDNWNWLSRPKEATMSLETANLCRENILDLKTSLRIFLLRIIELYIIFRRMQSTLIRVN